MQDHGASGQASTVVSEIQGMARRSSEEVAIERAITGIVGLAVSIIGLCVSLVLWVGKICISLLLLPFRLRRPANSGMITGSRNPSQNLKHEVFRKGGGQCARCGATDDLEYDHIYPYSRGGPTTLENLQLLCRDCNAKKRDKIPRSPPLSPVHDRIQVADDPQRSRFELALDKHWTFLGVVLGVIVLLFFLLLLSGV